MKLALRIAPIGSVICSHACLVVCFKSLRGAVGKRIQTNRVTVVARTQHPATAARITSGSTRPTFHGGRTGNCRLHSNVNTSFGSKVIVPGRVFC
jgi:hypothetical protein